MPEIVRRAVDGGHLIGNHGYDHTYDHLPQQFGRTWSALEQLALPTQRLFRPPGGRLTVSTLMWMVKCGHSTVMWSFDARDSLRDEGKSDEVIDYDDVQGGDIILMHDDNKVCSGELETLLQTIERKRLQVVPLTEMVGTAF
jgi:peptidoglycan/xylan/chitin deacetylase (PgdA/CDA1 family)